MNLFVYCAGGFGREVMDITRRVNRAGSRWDQVAFLDDIRKESTYYGAEVFGVEAACERFGAGEMEAVIANGEPSVRAVLAGKLAAAKVRLAALIDGSAVVSEDAVINAGTVIFPLCFVSSMARVGGNVAVVAGSMIGHDARVGENCVISGHVNIGGGCVIGDESYVGMGAQLKQRTHVGRRAIVGMGSVVFSDIPDEVIALGNPCRAMRANVTKRVFGSESSL